MPKLWLLPALREDESTSPVGSGEPLLSAAHAYLAMAAAVRSYQHLLSATLAPMRYLARHYVRQALCARPTSPEGLGAVLGVLVFLASVLGVLVFLASVAFLFWL